MITAFIPILLAGLGPQPVPLGNVGWAIYDPPLPHESAWLGTSSSLMYADSDNATTIVGPGVSGLLGTKGFGFNVAPNVYSVIVDITGEASDENGFILVGMRDAFGPLTETRLYFVPEGGGNITIEFNQVVESSDINSSDFGAWVRAFGYTEQPTSIKLDRLSVRVGVQPQ